MSTLHPSTTHRTAQSMCADVSVTPLSYSEKKALRLQQQPAGAVTVRGKRPLTRAAIGSVSTNVVGPAGFTKTPSALPACGC